MAPQSTPARWWHTERGEQGERVVCGLCPHGCRLRPGQSGLCKVRRNEGGSLVSLSYGRPTGFAVDPIEKKPLFHFLPGSRILSFGTLGCTLGCRFCQNWGLSHPAEIDSRLRFHPPADVVALARSEGLPAIAYTYNEPTVFAEYLVDVARLARAEGLRNVAVTNGYVTAQARPEVFANLDAANVDLKGFSDDFYRQQAQGRLQPVLDTLEWLHKQTSIWLEVTTLLIPGLNDSAEMISRQCEWIVATLGTDVPMHFTAFHPDYQLLDRPATPPATLAWARSLALRQGMRFVYTGNVADDDGQRTVCPGCGRVLIERSGHSARRVGIQGTACGQCGTAIAGVFEPEA